MWIKNQRLKGIIILGKNSIEAVFEFCPKFASVVAYGTFTVFFKIVTLTCDSSRKTFSLIWLTTLEIPLKGNKGCHL